MDRRQILGWTLAATATAGGAGNAWGIAINAPPIKFGIEDALVVSGFANHIQRAIGRDLGVPVDFQTGPGLDLLERARAGTLEIALTQVTEREVAMEKSGMIHTRRLVTTSSYLLVGPAADPAGVKEAPDVLKALDRIVAAGQASPDRVAYVSHGDLNGAHETEGGLWKALGPRPIGTWMKQAPRKGVRAALEMAAQLPGGGYTLVERGVWVKSKSPLKALFENDARLQAPYFIYLPFAVRHPAGKLLAGWLTTPSGQAAVKAFSKDYRGA